ncbi:hypothetical protein C0Q70_12246 [Pomacea canaliculata]|uniref:Uncharacterized protein n=1 Tax=Pomacea canaliculata TaxID=400727 RepID=A0A2T7P104_POMCA|nr:hypothetical protein C0Q70_12246 [Pomacea canaliculata]
MAPSLVWGQRLAYDASQIPIGPRKNGNDINQYFNLSEPEISKTQAVVNESAVLDSLPSASSDQGLNFPVTLQETKSQQSLPASVERKSQTPTTASNAISVASLRFNASDSPKHTVGVSSTGSTLLSLVRSNQSTSGGTTQPTVEASSGRFRQSSHLGSSQSFIGSNQSSSSTGYNQSSIGSSQSSSGGTTMASSAWPRQSSHLGSNLLSLLGSRQSFSGVFLDPPSHRAAHLLAREMGLVQYYEAHGCVDPNLHLPAGANGMGLALSCSAPQSQLLCQAVGHNSERIMTNMGAPPSVNSLFEFCLSQSTIRRLLTGVMQTDRVATDPALTMMMTSKVLGEGDPALTAMVMMRALAGSGTAISGAGGNKTLTGGATSVPRSESSPVGHVDQGAQQTGDLISRCKDVVLMLMMRPEVTLLDAIEDIRRQLMPYQCQEMTAGRGVTFRMCCPGHGEPLYLRENGQRQLSVCERERKRKN